MSKRAKITNSCVKGLVPSDRRVNDTEISGFHLLISPKGKISYYVYYRLDGKQVNFKLGSHPEITPAQARDLAKQKLGDVAKGIDVQKEKKKAKQLTELAKNNVLDRYLDNQYLPWLEARNPKTAMKIIKSIKTGFSELLNNQLSDIDAAEIEKWRIKKKKSGSKPSTINGYVASLKGAFSRAVEWNLIPEHDLHKVKSYKVDNQVIRYLSKDEETRLLEALKQRDARIKIERENGNLFRQQRDYPLLPELRNRSYCDYLEPLILLAMNTGMRRGELFSLTWENVDLETKNITVVGDKTKTGKTRHIPLNKMAQTVLSNLILDTVTKGNVFKNADDSPLKDIKKAWGNLLKEAHIENFRFHDLRHHFASKLVMASVDLNTVRELLGHSDLTMTLRYAHLAPEHKAAAVNLIG
ncbi:site-specific integrase [Thalassotalea sp. Y01]|uniref:site-specific integrase n=1 Tax=Thalassotalea sp. Y01 TaxID=2729613 RepID=UPI00145DBFD8|nr:site-specific integrase [Thalassotalea sp. Y01]NMP15173.1 site-specific integrase [Thalassotalea sp. Y01]